MSMTIGGLAKSAGVGVETVRYYQRRGLMPAPKGGGGVRRYGDQDVRRLSFIRSAQAAGFTLEQIGELLALDSTNGHDRARALAQERIAALTDRIAQLSAARASLKQLASACQSTSGQPCPIIAAFAQDGTV